MADTKSLCAKISTDLHAKVTAEKEESGLALNEYIEQILTEYYEFKEGGKIMAKENVKTLAIQIAPALMERVKEHLEKTGMTQKAFIVSLIEKALEETEKEELNKSFEPTESE